MPFINSITYYPKAGTAEDFRSLVEDHVHMMQAAGIEASLSATAWGEDYPTYRIGQRYVTLADCEQYRAASADATRRLAAAVAPLTRQPNTLAFSQSLQRTNQSGAVANWSQWTTHTPTFGKSLELRELLIERGDVYEVAGRRTTLSLQIAGPESGVYVRTFSYASLADLEEWRARGVDDETEEAFVQRLSLLVSRPLETSCPGDARPLRAVIAGRSTPESTPPVPTQRLSQNSGRR